VGVAVSSGVSCKSFYDKVVSRLLTLGRGPVVGLTDAEIKQIRADQGVSVLPLYYEEFLRRMGRQSGGFLAGTDVLYPDVLGLKGYARALLRENEVEDFLSDDVVVIAMHQGYQFYWIHVGLAGDPAVFMYSEGHTSTVFREWSTYSDFVQYYMSELE
jgi:hypothetical protein